MSDSDSLPPPTVDQASGDLLTASDVPLEATVRVEPYPGMVRGDLVTLSWAGHETAAYTISVPITGRAVGEPVVFKVPAAEILPESGGSVTLTYRVEHPNTPGAALSRPLVLHVELDRTQSPSV